MYPLSSRKSPDDCAELSVPSSNIVIRRCQQLASDADDAVDAVVAIMQMRKGVRALQQYEELSKALTPSTPPAQRPPSVARFGGNSQAHSWCGPVEERHSWAGTRWNGSAGHGPAIYSISPPIPILELAATVSI